jgi:hypothetical protein
LLVFLLFADQAMTKRMKRKKVMKVDPCPTKKRNSENYQKALPCAGFALRCLISLQY